MLSQRIQHLMQVASPIATFFMTANYNQHVADPDICDFMVGNPQEMALAGFSKALAEVTTPKHKFWYGYKNNEATSQRIVAHSLNSRYGIEFDAHDICMTNGAFAGLGVVLNTVVDAGDEVIFVSPPWFFYETLIEATGAKAVRVKCDLTTYDLDLTAIESAITPKTRAIIINSPNNPTGRIYPHATLEQLATLLTNASAKHGRPIYLVSDEAYSHIVYDGITFKTPTAYYPYSFLIYTYGKTLLTPGERLGYIALPPTMPEREMMRNALFIAQLSLGYAFPNALLQHALNNLEKLSVDVEHLQHKRNWLGGALQEMGYDLRLPEGTFYLLVKSPQESEVEFLQVLEQHKVFCLPGYVFEMPGYFRISLTANDDMIERGIPGFKKALEAVRV